MKRLYTGEVAIGMGVGGMLYGSLNEMGANYN